MDVAVGSSPILGYAALQQVLPTNVGLRLVGDGDKLNDFWCGGSGVIWVGSPRWERMGGEVYLGCSRQPEPVPYPAFDG